MKIKYKQVNHTELDLMDELLDCFGAAFEQEDVYGDFRPDAAYMESLLKGDSFIAIAALNEEKLIGGLAAYELKKFEQKRSEIYIYDLAVDEEYRRLGVATGLIEALKPIALKRGAWIVFVQADNGDEPAVNLYTNLGVREEVFHFDIPLSEGEG